MKRDETLHQAIEEILVKSDAHPDADTLVDYHEGTLPPADAQRVQDHLVVCRECAALVADLEGLGDPGFGADEDLPDETAELVWKNVRQQIRRDEGPSNVVSFRGRERAPDLPSWVRPLAAMLVISTMALSGWVAHLRDQVKDLSSPQINAPILDLYPAGSTRGEGAGDVQPVPADARDILLILHPPGRSRFAEHGVEIVDAGGRAVWRTDRGLALNADGLFTLGLPREYLGLRLRLVGIDPGGGRELVEEYALPAEEP